MFLTINSILFHLHQLPATDSKKAPVVKVKVAPFETAPVPPPASYATLDPQTFHSTAPPTRAAGNHPVFMPSSSQSSFPAPVATAPHPEPAQFKPRAPAAAGQNIFQPLPSLRVGPVAAGSTPPPPNAHPISNVFSTPLAGNPVIFSGPTGQEPNAPHAYTSAASPNKDSPKYNASSSSPSDMPWNDDDLLLYFSNPPRP